MPADAAATGAGWTGVEARTSPRGRVISAGHLPFSEGLVDIETPAMGESVVRLLTVHVSGPERHDGEAPYTYVVHADSMAETKRRAWLLHVWLDLAEDNAVPAAEQEVDPEDVVVIDCAEFPCHEDRPFACSHPHHFRQSSSATTATAECRCRYFWRQINDHGADSDGRAPIDLGALAALGYPIPITAPEDDRC